ncbi:MAG TPA: hypothetical protein VN151_01085 [Terracidiphilus sp.]|nr:hypothetical protein [Terracidiphilus sp.]
MLRPPALAAALLALAFACPAQTKVPHARTPAKPEPTEPELAEYIRGQLLALSPSDSINDNTEVTYNADTRVLTVTGPSGRCETSLPALNANALVWDLYDPSDTDRTREKLLRLTFVSVSGKTARTCYDAQGRVNSLMPTNRARFLFSESHADETPDFQKKMAKAFQKLIALTGGTPQKDLF